MWFVDWSTSILRANFGPIQLWFIVVELISLVPQLSESSTFVSSWSRRADYLRDSVLPLQVIGTSVHISPPLQQTQYNCQTDKSVSSRTNHLHSLHIQNHMDSNSQPFYKVLSEVPQEPTHSNFLVDQQIASPVQPCFDPYEAVQITAAVHSTAQIPCTVHNIDFQSTVVSHNA